MTRNMTVRIPDDLADDIETVARVQGTSVNALTLQALAVAVNAVRADPEFVATARALIDRDRGILERLAGQ